MTDPDVKYLREDELRSKTGGGGVLFQHYTPRIPWLKGAKELPCGEKTA
jgi:hypothetical protein